MTEEKFLEIMEDESIKTIFPEGDNALAGLLIVAKYLPKSGIEGADHDIIYSANIDDLIEVGITEEDTRKLKELNWGVEDSTYLYCFV